MNAIYKHPGEDKFTFLENVPEKLIINCLGNEVCCNGKICEYFTQTEKYERALAECIKKRMVIGNPEVLKGCMTIMPVTGFLFPIEFKEGELYPWPGTWYKAKQFRYKPNSTDGGWTAWLDGSTSIPDKEIERREAVILSPPKEERDEDYKKIAEGICISERGVDHCPNCTDSCDAFHHKHNIHELSNPDERPLAVEGSQVVGVNEKDELKEAIAGQETLALDLFRCMDLLNRCYWNMLSHAPSDKTMSHAEWMDCLNEIELFRTEHPPTKFANVKKPEPVVSQDQQELWEDVLLITDNPRRDYLNDEALIKKLSERFTISRKPID